MTTTLHTTEVAAFATAVREALSDLPPDELDELTDGLMADLAERLDEAPDAAVGLGDPLAYAEELRSAAGYPPRSARGHLGATLPNLRTIPADLRRGWVSLLEEHPRLRSVADFFVALRPVWWVLRGVAVYAVIAWFFGFAGQAFWPLAVAFVVLSVQVGRGWRLAHPAALWSMRAVSVVAVIAAPFLLGGALTTWNNAQFAGAYYGQEETYYPHGLTVDGQQVDNIFAYDAQGNPIDQVQLFDQEGRPLNLTSDPAVQWWDAQDGSMVVPSGDVPGRAGWNVYPLAHVNDWSDVEDDGMLDDSEISATEFPFLIVKPLAGEAVTPMTEGSPIAAPTPDPTPAP